MTAATTRPKAAEHEVWMNITVFVKRTGERSAWRKYFKGTAKLIKATTHESAIRQAFRQLDEPTDQPGERP